MPAYLVDLAARQCQHFGCQRRATVEVRNARNAPVGWFCRRHGQAEVDDLNKS
jgi:Rieske Fe-S protein